MPFPGNNTLAVLVVSCDNYSDLWDIFHKQFLRFWPSCPLRTYLLTNQLEPELPPFVPLPVGPDVSWSDNLRAALARIDEDFVLLFLEDLLLNAPVDPVRLEPLLHWVVQNRPDSIRLNCTERPTSRLTDQIGHVAPGAIYRTSTVLSLWKKETLLDLLKPGESAWEFELKGSERSDRYEGFYSVYADLFPILNGVIKRKWVPAVVERLAELGIQVDLGRRPMMTSREVLKLKAGICRTRVFKLLPWRMRRRVRQAFKS